MKGSDARSARSEGPAAPDNTHGSVLHLSGMHSGPIEARLSRCLTVWFTFHLFGMRYGLYDHSSAFDKAMHAIITYGFVAMWIAWAWVTIRDVSRAT